jgi:hypothetical protein
MAVIAQVAHRIRGRLRLRIPEKRKDLSFFLTLYEELRSAPAVGEVTMNPLTGSVLLHFEERDRDAVTDALRASQLIAVTQPSPTAKALARIRGEESEGTAALVPRRATDARSLLFLVMLGLSLHQLLRGHLLAPALTLLLYGADLVTSYQREKQLPETRDRTDAY